MNYSRDELFMETEYLVFIIHIPLNMTGDFIICDLRQVLGTPRHQARHSRLNPADSNGQSFLPFSQDLLTVCRELNLENSVEELMRELGADEHGRISYQEFLRRRLALRPEIEALRAGKRRSSPHHTHTPEYLPTSSDNSLGKNRTNSSNPSFPHATINLTKVNGSE